jgi:SAM-dependent methyltransferase
MPVDLLSYTDDTQPSMNPHFRQLGQSELLPRYIFAESLIARRRVLEIGGVAATSGRSALFLLQRGARSVVACDADLPAIEQAQKELSSPQLQFRASEFEDFEPGEFDAVLIADLAPYVRAPQLLKNLARVVAGHGYLIGGLRNPSGFELSQLLEPKGSEPPTFGQLLDALSPHFRSVEVATQSPVLAYQLAFEGAEGLLVDGTLVNRVEAAYFLVLAGQEPAGSLDPRWVQLPPEPLEAARAAARHASPHWKALNEASERTNRLQLENVRLVRQLSEQQQGAQEALARAASEEEKLRSSLDWAESERVRLAEELLKAASASARDAELSAAIADREAKLHILQQRLAAQSVELSALRSSVGRWMPQQVNQIYQRASAELNAVKAEIRRAASIPAEKPLEDSPVANPPGALPEPGEKAKKS